MCFVFIIVGWRPCSLSTRNANIQYMTFYYCIAGGFGRLYASKKKFNNLIYVVLKPILYVTMPKLTIELLWHDEYYFSHRYSDNDHDSVFFFLLRLTGICCI